jgi:hypothetical protein
MGAALVSVTGLVLVGAAELRSNLPRGRTLVFGRGYAKWRQLRFSAFATEVLEACWNSPGNVTIGSITMRFATRYESNNHVAVARLGLSYKFNGS